MNKILYKKKQGDANYISGLIVTAMLLIFTIACTAGFTDLTRAADIRSACRGYMYTMEVNGCLTASNQALLQEELEALGCQNISFEGTTTTEQTYGTLITLDVQLDMPISIFNIKSLTGNMEMTRVNFLRRTVSKN